MENNTEHQKKAVYVQWEMIWKQTGRVTTLKTEFHHSGKPPFSPAKTGFWALLHAGRQKSLTNIQK